MRNFAFLLLSAVVPLSRVNSHKPRLARYRFTVRSSLRLQLLSCTPWRQNASHPEMGFSVISCVNKRKCTHGARHVPLASFASTYGFAAGKDIAKIVSDGGITLCNLAKHGTVKLLVFVGVFGQFDFVLCGTEIQRHVQRFFNDAFQFEAKFAVVCFVQIHCE